MWARTEDDKNKWVAAIREALGNVLPLGQPLLQVSQQQGRYSADKFTELLLILAGISNAFEGRKQYPAPGALFQG